MNKLEKWFIKNVFRKEVIQSPTHAKNIRNIYGTI